MNRTVVLTFVFWSLVASLALLVPIQPFVGGGTPFTAFEFVGPAGGALFGALAGGLAATTAKGINLWVVGGVFSAFALIRLLTPAAAAIYLSAKQPWILAVPVLAMLAFWINPTGREVWYYALYWLIPLALWPYRRQLFVRSMGATFTAHALGGAAFVWLMPTTATLWQSLLPLVIVERIAFAAGISLTVLGFEQAMQRFPGFAHLMGSTPGLARLSQGGTI